MSASRVRVAVLCVAALASCPWSRAQEAVSAGAPADLNAARENLQYSIEWRLIPAGLARFTWKPTPGSAIAASEARIHLESTGIVSRLFRVDDDYTSMLAQSFCSGGTFMTAREGSRNKETRVTYDQDAHRAKYQENDLVKNVVTNREVELPPCAHDVVAALIALRALHLEPGKMADIPISDGKKSAMVKVEAQRREGVTTPLGNFQTIRYEVFLFDNVIYKRPAHVHIWLTDDAVRLPVQVEVRLQFAIGTITLKLAKEERLPL